jgi:hypothetical protein
MSHFYFSVRQHKKSLQKIQKMSKPMHLPLFTTLAVLFGVACADQNSTNLYDLTAVDIDGNAISMSQYAGNVSLVVNVATY